MTGYRAIPPIRQIQAVSQPGDSNCGPHVQVYALCEDGSLWVRYSSSGFSNVPTHGSWERVSRATTEVVRMSNE